MTTFVTFAGSLVAKVRKPLILLWRSRRWRLGAELNRRIYEREKAEDLVPWTGKVESALADIFENVPKANQGHQWLRVRADSVEPGTGGDVR